jgi:hypothetical protein
MEQKTRFDLEAEARYAPSFHKDDCDVEETIEHKLAMLIGADVQREEGLILREVTS